MKNIALIGYGEVGRILAEDLRRQGMTVSACDVKVGSADTTASAAMRAHAAGVGVALTAAHAEAVAGPAGIPFAHADLVISAVTASQAIAAAAACAPAMKKGAFFLDINSASPATKIEAAGLIDGAGGRYVEGAVMTSIPPYRIRVPLLLGGPAAAALAPALAALGFDAKLASDELGVASATKMCRSVMIKGLEAMVIEGFTAARAYGVEDRVLASLAETLPGIDWEKQGSYFFQRVIRHGRRRAEEMHEVAQTVREAGLEPWSASGSAERDAWMADLADAGVFGDRDAKRSDWRADADRVLAAIRGGE
jgi:3-hydroxyisobutyrate dehydrogenase-like beta-hydroxyacid dehydrogenase